MNSLPKELQLSDKDIESLTLQDMEALFNLASSLGITDKFAQIFWQKVQRVRCQYENASLQKCVKSLEERKRSIGRAYNVAKSKYGNGWLTKYQVMRYNEVEFEIRFLVQEYGCKRKSKPYLLEV